MLTKRFRWEIFLSTLLLFFIILSCHHPIHVPTNKSDENSPPVATLPLPGIGVVDKSQEFADLFYSVLKSEPSFQEWLCCDRYLRLPGHPSDAMPGLSTNYKVLLISGLFSQCLKTITAFSDAASHLAMMHALSVVYLEVPALGSSEENGQRIANYVDEEYEKDGRRFIIIGYSKGAPDSQFALTKLTHPEAVTALVAVAGSIGGSRLADVLAGQFSLWFRKLHLSPLCDVADAKGFIDLKRDRRHEFLQKYPNALVPTYCIAAVSTRQNTSRILVDAWDYLSFFERDQDSQMIASDTVAPHSTFLGIANGDHWAVAMPFEDAHDTLINLLVDKNHFPRPILLEAILRFVAGDLLKLHATQ